MRFLIIGSNSFSGASFINFLLSKNHDVVGVSRSAEINKLFLKYKENKNINKFSFYRIDINKHTNKLVSLVKKFKPEYIVNYSAQGMVAESWNNPIHWYRTNLLSQVAFHNEIKGFKFIKKYIHFTTPEVYGSTKKWIKENYNFEPSTPYAVSRAACDLHLRSFYNAYKFPIIFTRAANVYGPGQQLYRIVPKTMLSSVMKKNMFLHGGGKSVRSFIHINDVSDALYKIVKRGKIGETYHISTNEIISIKKLVTKICAMLNIKIEKIVQVDKDRLGKDQAYLLDSSKIRIDLGWKDKISLEDGLKDTLKWINDSISSLKELPHEYKHKE